MGNRICGKLAGIKHLPKLPHHPEHPKTRVILDPVILGIYAISVVF
jgi:hypothetical protein